MRIGASRGAWSAVAAAAILAQPLPLFAAPADLRVGYIDSARIFQEYATAKEAQTRFDHQVEGWRAEAAEKQKVVQQLRDEMRDQSPVLSAARRQEKEETLQHAVSDYERFIQDTWGPQGRAVRENEQATNQVLVQIRAAVEKVAADKGLFLVFDSASGFIVYADRTLDLTNEVLVELNTGLKQSGTH
jgi:Skp family chaperone for outer membrane proteins